MYKNPQRQVASRLSRTRRAGVLALATSSAVLFGSTAAADAATVKVVQAGVPRVFEISTPGVEPDQITAGPDGSVWYTATTTNGLTSEIGELTATDQQQYFSKGIAQKNALGQPAGLGSIAEGPDENLWFTASGGTVYRISSGVGNSGDGPLGSVKFQSGGGILPELGGITSGPGGRLSFTESSGQVNAPVQVGSIGVHGGVTGGPSASPDLPEAIVQDGQGNLWFTEPNTGQLARVDPQGQVAQFASGVVGPLGIALGPDGNIWYTGENAIGEIAPTGGTPEVFSLAGLSNEPVLARAITAGPDGNLWFTTDSNSIGTITTAGVPSLITQGVTGQPTLGITATANEVYFTEGSSDKIGVVSFCGAVVCQPRVVQTAQDVTIESTLVRSANVGILVQRLVDGRRVKIGRVPLGHHSRGALALRWNGKVNGTRIPDGHYLITLRALNADKQVIDRSAPVLVAISWGGSSEGGKPQTA
jgi:streptogramin lyase